MIYDDVFRRMSLFGYKMLKKCHACMIHDSWSDLVVVNVFINDIRISSHDWMMLKWPKL